MQQDLQPILEWLSARLSRGPATPRDLKDEATGLGITQGELDAARRKLRLVLQWQEPASGGPKYMTWALPPTSGSRLRPGYDPRRYAQPARPAAQGHTTEAVAKAPADPKEKVEAARRVLQRRSVTLARTLTDLAKRASADATPCPTCGRGTPRAEDLRLRAAVAALDRAGLGVPRGDGAGAAEGGFQMVFPPGTRVAVIAPPGEQPPPRLVRADELPPASQGT